MISIILKERTDGYIIAANAQNALTTGNGLNYALCQYSQRNSLFSAALIYDYASISRRKVDDSNSYLIGDAWHNIVKNGRNTWLKYDSETLELNYNYYLPGNIIFDISATGNYYYSAHRGQMQQVIEDGRADYFQYTRPYENNFTPNINFFLKKFLPNNSYISASLSANYIGQKYKYDYDESTSEDMKNIFYNYGYSTRGHRQVYIGEIKYNNPFTRSLGLNVGARGNYSNSYNKYHGDIDNNSRVQSTNIYTYATAYGYLANYKLYYYAGFGLSGNFTRQDNIKENVWTPQPSFFIRYRLGNWFWALNGSMTQRQPSSAMLSDTEFKINNFEYLRGNPRLSSWTQYRSGFKINGTVGKVSLMNSLQYNYDRKPVCGITIRETSDQLVKFINTYANAKRFSSLSNYFYVQWSLNANCSMSGGAQFISYRAKGEHFNRKLNTWKFDMAFDWNAGPWNAGIQWNSRSESIFGETRNISSPSNSLYVKYRIGDFTFGLTAENLLVSHGFYEKDFVEAPTMRTSDIVYAPSMGNKLTLSISWNMIRGKQRDTVDVDLVNRDRESGVLKK